MTATVHGLGLGPGDPELITLKAHRLITGCPVIAYPAPDEGESFARSIDRFPAQSVYDAAAEAIAGHAQAGREVAVLCEGDPFFYGSFMYLFARLAEQVPVAVVPGVTSLTACAAAAQTPLCARNEPLTVLPGPLEDAALSARLDQGGAFAIMKVGRHLPRIRALLEARGAARRATYLSHASLEAQRVLPLAEAPEAAPYFSMILIPGEDPYASA